MLCHEGRETEGEGHAVHVCVTVLDIRRQTNSLQHEQPTAHAPVSAALANTKLTVAPEPGPALRFLQTLYSLQGQALKDLIALN